MLVKARDWLLDRSSLGPETYQSLNVGVPKGVGWLHTLGGVALGLLLLQAVTGIFLAMYYSPHPDAAYESLRYIDRQLPGGRLVHGLHHYGSAATIIVVMLHLLRTYFQGAYKAPRELNWILGVVLLLLVLGFDFTGVLLPWDQNGYFGTNIRTHYPAGVPVLGPVMQQLLRGGKEVGALTITRFYAIHILLLPALLIPLLWAHLRLAWRKGLTAPGTRVGETPRTAGRFMEGQLFRNVAAMFVAFGLVYLMASLRPVTVGFKANPADATYTPHAEWYFLFLFQLLRDMGEVQGLNKIIPTWLPALTIPGIVVLFLMLAPWIDRGPDRALNRRKLMMGLMIGGLTVIGALSFRAALMIHPNATPANSLYGTYTRGGELDLDPKLVAAGKSAFDTAKPVKCSQCHRAYTDFTTASSGPDLSGYGLKTLPVTPGVPEAKSGPLSFHERYRQYIRGTLRPEKDGQRASAMPNYPEDMLSDEELEAIGAYLSQDPARVKRIEHLSPQPIEK